MEHLKDAALRRWAIQVIANNSAFESLKDTSVICRLAMELVEFVRTGQQPPEPLPPPIKRH